MYRRYLESEAYILRVTAADCPASLRRRIVYAARPDAIREAERKAVRRLQGEYLDTETATLEVLLSELSLLGKPQETKAMTNSDTAGNAHGHVILLAIPTDAKVPAGFTPITPATALRIIGDAFVTIPKPPPDCQRYRPVNRSRGWGDELIEEPGDFRAEGTAAFGVAEAKEIVRIAHIEAPAGRIRRAVSQPVGWSAGGPARDLAVSLILRGIGAPTRPTVERAAMLIREWVEWMPPDIGDGRQVEQIIRGHLWVGPVGWLEESQVREAHQQDVRANEYQREAAEVGRAIREQWKADPNSLPRLVRETLEVTEPKVMSAAECARRLQKLRRAA